MIVWQEIISEYGEVNCLLAVRAFTMGAERTVETTQLALRFGDQRERLRVSKVANLYFQLYTIGIFAVYFCSY